MRAPSRESTRIGRCAVSTRAPAFGSYGILLKVNAKGTPPRELYRIQSYGAAVYHAELGAELRSLGYRVSTGTNHSAEIVGYTKEYLESISDRRREIKEALESRGLRGAEAAENLAHQLRAGKQVWNPDELREEHREHAAKYGSPGEKIVAEARVRQVQQIAPELVEKKAGEALNFARNRLSE